MRLPIKIALALLFCLGAASISSATTLERLSLERLSVESDTVVRAKSISSRSAWGPRGRLIYTYYTLELKTIVASNGKSSMLPGSYFEIMVPGGRVGDIEMIVPGAVKIDHGEDALLFLKKRIDNRGLMIYGLSQGRYGIYTDKKSGKLMARRKMDSKHVKFVGKERLAPDGPFPLDELISKIKTLRKESRK